MNKQSASICSGLFLCIAGALSGCATNGMTRSGFLDTYETLAPTRYKHVLMFREPGFDPGRYAEVVVEHPLIKTGSGRIEGLDDAQQREVLDYVDTELHRQVSKIPAAPGAAARGGDRTPNTQSDGQRDNAAVGRASHNRRRESGVRGGR